MDQIKEVLKYKFWILLGIGVLMTFTGWWMATGALAATIKARKEVLSKVEGSIPSSPSTIPNDRWSAELSKINDQQQALVTAATKDLWERQKARQFWPPTVGDFAKDLAFRGEFPPTARELYRSNYEYDAERVWKIIRPINKFDGSGIVDFPGARFPMRKWGELAPTSVEMWDAQEDLWLLEPLLESIRDLNGDENSTRLDAAVYVIERLELVGGMRGQPIDAPAASGGADGAMGGFPGDAGALSPSMGRSSSSESGPLAGGTMGGALAGAKFGQVAADFNYKEEFGDGGDPPWKTGSGGGQAGGNMGMGMAAFGEGDGGAATTTESSYRRYVDDDAALPYKTRGFYMTVIMDHRRVPELIAALTANGKSDWPVEVVRVQVARINSDDSEMPAQSGMGPNMGLAGESYAPGGFAETMSSEFSGPMGENFGGSGTASGFKSEQVNPNQDEDFRGPMMPNANTMTFQNVLRDPYVAKVALCGLIYLYNPVVLPETPAAETPPAEPAATETMPAEQPPAATEPMPADGTEPAATEPTKDPAAPGSSETAPPSDPSTPTESAPTQPESGTNPPN